jgi:hypothetical protein
MTRLASLLALLVLTACSSASRPVSPLQRAEITRTIKNEVTQAYDLSQPNVVERLMSLYPTAGRIISASGGQVVTSRDSLRMGIVAFWDNVGRNMRNPTVDWTSMYIDVLSPTAAVMTATYRIPHTQPNGLPHVIGGAWTAVFELQNEHWVIIQEHLSDNPFAT